MSTVIATAGAVTAISAAAAVIWKMMSWAHRLIESERCQLRHIMLRTYYNHNITKQIRQYEYENFEKSYAAYKALNGNSFIDKIYKEVNGWEVIS